MKKNAILIALIIILLTVSACTRQPRQMEEKTDTSAIDSVQPVKNAYPSQESLPQKYPSDLASKNGDVVFAKGNTANQEKLLKFIEAYENKKAAPGDMVRITNYTTEGDAIITDLIIDSTGIKLIEDTTRDNFSNQDNRKRTEYRVTEIVKTEKSEGTTFTAKLNNGEERYLTYMPNSK